MSKMNPNILDEQIENEIWKIHPIYTLYEASNFGRIRRSDTKKIKIQHLDDRFCKPGRWKINIYDNDKKAHFCDAARFILTSFTKVNNEMFVDHIDSDSSNNFLENLRWVNRKENNNNPNSRMKYTPSSTTNDTTKIKCFNLDGSFFRNFNSITEAVEFLGRDKKTNIGANITAVCAGRQKTAYGYKWEYDEEPLLDGEIFKKHPILDIEVSNMGRVMFRRKNGYKRITYGGKHTCGYLAIQAPHTNKKFLVHRLVAEVFLPNPENKSFVNHINSNHLDNRLENIEWCTQQENMRSEETHKKTSFKVDMCDKDGNVIKTFNSIKNMCKEMNFSSSCVISCCKGRTDFHKGYKFKYNNSKQL